MRHAEVGECDRTTRDLEAGFAAEHDPLLPAIVIVVCHEHELRFR